MLLNIITRSIQELRKSAEAKRSTGELSPRVTVMFPNATEVPVTQTALQTCI